MAPSPREGGGIIKILLIIKTYGKNFFKTELNFMTRQIFININTQLGKIILRGGGEERREGNGEVVVVQSFGKTWETPFFVENFRIFSSPFLSTFFSYDNKIYR